MNLLLAAWRAFPAAPETPSLRRLRTRCLFSLMLTAVLVAWSHLLWLIHPFLVLLMPLVGIHAIIVTGRYWVTKNRADAAHQAMLGADDGERTP